MREKQTGDKEPVAVEQKIIPTKRKYNQWVANETLEDFALRYTAKRARKWSTARIANTALGVVSFLALEAIGGAITLQYGFTNSMWAILVVCALIFIMGLPICYYAAKSGLDIDLLTRGAGFGYIGSTISSLIYASFTFIFFALEAAIMSMALQLLLGIPLSWAYVISTLLVIPLVTHGITRISLFQLWSQPIWITLQIASLLFIIYHNSNAIYDWTHFAGLNDNGGESFNLILFGAAAAVIFPLMAQNGEQVDYLRFLPKEQENTPKWWAALILSGPGWTLFGVAKLFAGSFLAVLALQHGIVAELADDPTHMYMMAFGYITNNPDIALLIAAIFVIISQLKINVTNAYAGSIAWSNFFSRLTHNHPGRIVWLLFNVSIALLLMELGLYQTFESILITYSTLVLAWVGSLVADLVINKALGLRPAHIEFKRGHLYDINPVGVGSMLIASALGICGQLGLFGPTFKALSPFIALFIPFITAPLIAYITKSRYYAVRDHELNTDEEVLSCIICENSFEPEDMSQCPAYGGTICSLCCVLDSSCRDQCRPDAHLQAQTHAVLSRIFPPVFVDKLHSSIGHFLMIMIAISLLIAGLFTLVYLSLGDLSDGTASILGSTLLKTFFLLMTVTGVLIWLYVLAQESKQKALNESRQQMDLLSQEVFAHKKTTSELKAAKEMAITANQAKSSYLSGVSHELRTPLNTVLGYAQLLEMDSSLSSKNHRASTAIRRNSEHLGSVIEGLLEISKIEARRLDLHRDQINFTDLIDQLVDMFSIQAQAKNLTFKYSQDPHLPTDVIADEKRLRQVLMNLLSNAVKFTRHGQVSMHVSYRSEVARFTISDSGVGIKAEDQARIFEPFERVRNEETQFISGTGQGLAISHLLCNLMGGDLSVSSEYGQGSTFTLTVMLPTMRDPKPERVIKQPIIAYAGSRKTVLVVDDEPAHRALISDFMSPLGFTVIEAHNAEFALKMAAEFLVDLFVLDVQMPETDGWALATQLRNVGNNAPIFMASGNAIEVHHKKMKNLLHDEYLIKPINLAIFLEKVGSALRLEWRYAVKQETSASALAAPNKGYMPKEIDLDELISMAQIGYLSGVLEKLEAMEKSNADSEFLKELKSRAMACNFDGIIQVIGELKHANKD